jgi:CRP/FNR family transcriptional regulator
MGVHEDPTVAIAIARSRLRSLPGATLARLFEHTVSLEVPAGAVPQRQGRESMVPGLLISGLLRVFLTTTDGRQMTVRYVRPGGLLAIVTLYAKRTGPLSQQALTPCRIVRFRPEDCLHAAAHDSAVANLFAEEVSERLLAYVDELAGCTFGTMRQRVVRHLLDLAADRSRTPLVARISQQALADSVGSAREVIVRVLRELREEQLVRTGRDQIELLEPGRLLDETFPLEP